MKKPPINTYSASLVVRLLQILLLYSVSLSTSCTTEKNSTATLTQVYFSPKGQCANAIITSIGKAKNSISVAAYAFTSNDIIAALKKAQQRGVYVEIIIDKDFNLQPSNKSLEKIIKALDSGSNIFVNKNYIEKQHNKFIIIDDNILLTGSYNYTQSAENKNLENLLISSDKKIVNSYREEFERMKNIDTFSINLAWVKQEKAKLINSKKNAKRK